MVQNSWRKEDEERPCGCNLFVGLAFFEYKKAELD
tara:strand:+ start:356 stop:460 length:105 start_codon:yes stop_codon:yes gene_type:complete